MNRLTINKRLVLPLVVLIALAVGLTAVTAAVLSSQNIPTSGSIQGVGSQTSNGGGDASQNVITSTLNIAIYNDAAATINCSSINWGVLNPGDIATKTVFLKNTGNTEATLSLSATSWTPIDASSVLTLTWNKEGSTLAAGAMVPATLTLHVAADTGDLTSFSLNIVVSGSAP